MRRIETWQTKTTLTFALMDGPYEQARSTTALRLIGIAARRGYDINVFAYEGAVGLPFAKQRRPPQRGPRPRRRRGEIIHCPTAGSGL